ncbi:hypothetical protein [Treponema saccharophilum]|uniref:hypothetical protein n=1 Tax=Treponema saccharophilum TaxID=165 RepID=UPI00386E7B83
MKRILAFALAFSALPAFPDVFPGAQKLIESFFCRGTFIRIEYSADSISYFHKESLAEIVATQKGISVCPSGYEHGLTFEQQRWTIRADENSNIVITRK